MNALLLAPFWIGISLVTSMAVDAPRITAGTQRTTSFELIFAKLDRRGSPNSSRSIKPLFSGLHESTLTARVLTVRLHALPLIRSATRLAVALSLSGKSREQFFMLAAGTRINARLLEYASNVHPALLHYVVENLQKRDGVMNAVTSNTTNARAESLNARIQWIKRTACGFRNRARFKTAIYFHLGGLDLYPASLKSAHTNS